MGLQTAIVPSHVPPELVFDLDIYSDPYFGTDMHARMAELYQKHPDIFYTTASGGYWVVMRHNYINEVVTQPDRFSSRQGHIPPVVPINHLLPLSYDPPDNNPYRVGLMRYFGPRGINAMAAEIRELAITLFDKIKDQDSFEFVRPVGGGLPITVFMNLVGLELERFDEFRALVLEYFSVIPDERRLELHHEIGEVMGALITAAEQRRGEDLISKLLDTDVNGRPINHEELLSMAKLLFFAGMDTVANAASFMMYYLAQRPDLQDRLYADHGLIPDFVEESLRMYGVVNTPRQVRVDTELGGVKMKEGEMVFVLLVLAGRDERWVPNPNEFKIDRPSHPHMTFGGGPHVCAGQYLARVELRVMLEEWFKRYKRFTLAPGYVPEFRSWQVMALSKLNLVITERA